MMRNKLSTAILIGALVAGHAGAIPITLGGLPSLREATLDSAVEGFAGSGNATAAIVDGYLASLAPWTEVGSVEPDTGGPGPYSQGLLDIVLLSGIWGDSPAAGTWAINGATFWTDHAEAAISLHVGNGGGEYDHFVWRIEPGVLSGTWSYDGGALGGGGLSNLKLHTTGTAVPDGGVTIALLGMGIMGFALLKRRLG